MRRLLPLVVGLAASSLATAQTPPNVVVFLADDLGYADVGPYDDDNDPQTPDVTNTPELDQLATEGVRMTAFYANASVCSPSRAALLTGRHSIRSGITQVFGPNDPNGLPPSEITIAEMLEPLGYRTGIVGKWHLGDQLQYLPLQQGFDSFYGVPFSNNSPSVYLIRDNTVISPTVNQEMLTQDFTTEAIQFIDDAVAASEPFFLYMPYTAPHTPLFPSPGFNGITGRGAYPDTVFEMDWSIGQILDRLDFHGLTNDTFVVFCSDNGTCNNATVGPDPGEPGENDPWRWACGSNAPFSGFKFGILEGGVRSPFIARWPGVLPAGVVRDTIGSLLDVLPTIAGITGATVPFDRPIDGEDLFGILTADAPRVLDELHFYRLFGGAQWGSRELVSTRRGKWKQYYNSAFTPVALYDVLGDPSESTSITNPAVSKTIYDRSRDFDCRLDDPVSYVDPLDLASFRPVTVTSSVGCRTSTRAVDGSLATRWSSAAAGSEDLLVDFGSVQAMQRVLIYWGPNFAVEYDVSLSKNGTTWTQAYHETSGNGGRDIIALTKSARYLRVECAHGPGVGYEIRELRVQPALLPHSIHPAK